MFGQNSTIEVQRKTKEVEISSEEVKKAAELVKKISADVKAGVAPKSDLIKAMKDLESKAVVAKTLTSSLSGYFDKKGSPFILLLIVILILYICRK